MGVGVVTNIVVTVMAVSGVEGVGRVAVMEVDIEILVGVVMSVVAVVTTGVDAALVLSSVVINVDERVCGQGGD